MNSLPTVKVFRHGRIIDTLHGAESEPSLRRFIDKHVAPTSATPVLRAVAQAYGEGDIAQAAELAARAALAQPEDPRLAVNVVEACAVRVKSKIPGTRGLTKPRGEGRRAAAECEV